MKKWIVFLIALLVPVFLFAQDPEVPTDVADLLGNLGQYVGSLAGLAGIVIFVSGILIRVLKFEKKWLRLITAFVIALVVAILTNLLNFGLFAEYTWVQTIGWGVGLGLVAGSIFDIPTVKIVVELVLSLLQFKKPE